MPLLMVPVIVDMPFYSSLAPRGRLCRLPTATRCEPTCLAGKRARVRRVIVLDIQPLRISAQAA
jgi:hypothetical protein